MDGNKIQEQLLEWYSLGENADTVGPVSSSPLLEVRGMKQQPLSQTYAKTGEYRGAILSGYCCHRYKMAADMTSPVKIF